MSTHTDPLDAALAAERRMTTDEVARAVGVGSRTTIWRWVAAGTFPRPIRQRGRTRWRAADVVAWLRAQGGEAA